MLLVNANGIGLGTAWELLSHDVVPDIMRDRVFLLYTYWDGDRDKTRNDLTTEYDGKLLDAIVPPRKKC